MVIFPDELVVSTPPGFIEQQRCRVILRLFEATANARETAARYGERIVHIDMNARALDSPGGLEFLAEHKICLFVEDEDLPLIHRIARSAVKHNLVLFIRADGKAKRRINLLSEYDIPMHVAIGERSDEGARPADLLQYYLHNPLLRAPVAPFNAFMKHEIDGKGFTLWDTEYEKPGRYLYITEEGNVTLSRRFHQAGVDFGTVDSEWKDIAASEAYLRLLAYRDSLFRDGKECAYCDAFKFCGGYLKAVDEGEPCDQWKEAFREIGLTVEKAKDLIREGYGKQP